MIPAALGRLARAARGFSPDTRRFLAGTAAMGLGLGAQMAHLNLYFRSLGLDETAIGGILSAGSLGVVAVSLPAAVWADRFRAESVFVAAAAGFAATFLLTVLVPDPWILRGLAFLTGALFTVHWVVSAPFFMRVEPPGHRTELFGLCAALETLATIAGAAGTGLLADALAGATGSVEAGLRTALAVAAALSLAAVLPFGRIRSAPPAGPRRDWAAYLVSREMGLVLRLSLPAFLVGCGAGLTIPFLNLYFRDRFDRDPGAIGLYFSVAQALTMLGFLLGPALARRFTHVRAIVATELLSVPFLVVLALSGSLWLSVAAFWARGALMNMNQPVSSAFAMEIVPGDQRTVTNSVRTFAWNVSWMISTATGGWLLDRHGYVPGMLATAGLYVLGAGTFWAFFRGTVVPAGEPAAPPPAPEVP